MSAQSRSPSPKRKPQQASQQRIGGIGVLSSPKFSFRAALVQHKASKLASKTPYASNDTSVVVQSDARITQPQTPALATRSQDSKISRPVRTVTAASNSASSSTSSIPSLSFRGRFNSTSSDVASTSTLPRRRNVDQSPETTRASSSLGKRPMDEAAFASINDASSFSDFGPIMRGKPTSASVSGVPKIASTSARPPIKPSSRLPGPPSARSQWNAATASLKSMPSPSSSTKAPRKIARSDGVAEVHAAASTTTTTTVSPNTAPSETRIGSVRNRTISTTNRSVQQAQSQPHQNRPKIGTLPKPKPTTAPVKTLLDERPSGLLNDESDGSGSDQDSAEEDVDQQSLDGPDVSRIRMRRVVSQSADETGSMQTPSLSHSKMLPPSINNGSTGSRIPSIGSTASRNVSRPHRRSSSNSIALAAAATAAAGEKENLSQPPLSQSNVGSKRHSVGASLSVQGRARSSLPLAVTQPMTNQIAAADKHKRSIHVPNLSGEDLIRTAQPAQQSDPIPPISPSKSTSLAALRSRGLQPDSHMAATAKTSASADSSLPSRSSRQDFGIKASIISANPMHPSILALQSKSVHQPISTPEALIKAKKRLSGALLSSSSSSSALSAVGSTASPSERVSSLGRSSSVKRLAPSKSNTQSTPRSGLKKTEKLDTTPSNSMATLPRSGSRSPIKSSLILFPSTAAPLNPVQHENQQRTEVGVSPAVRSSTFSSAKATSNDIIPSQQQQRNRVLSSSEIDASLLASLRVVAQKANLNVRDLLDEEQRLRQQDNQDEEHVEMLSEQSRDDASATKMQERARRQASEELEALAGDVSVDLMALDLATAGSPTNSDTSMLRSPVAGQAEYLDTPPSVFAAMAKHIAQGQQALQQREEDEEAKQEGEHQNDEDETPDTSCASPSVRAAASRLPRTQAPTQSGTVDTPMRRSYRNVSSIPSTPFPSQHAAALSSSPSKSARAYPPSVGMSAKTRSRLKKALRESLGIEAHFATINLATVNNKPGGVDEEQLTDEKASVEENGSKKGNDDLRKSISTMLLTDDDAYLDELVSAVARIGLEDERASSSPSSASAIASPSNRSASSQADVDPTHTTPSASATSSTTFVQTQLATALAEISALQSALSASQNTTSTLQTQLDSQRSCAARAHKTQAMLEDELFKMQRELAGVEMEKAKMGWRQVRVEGLTQLEEWKADKDSMLVLDVQLKIWEAIIRRTMV